MPHEFQRNRWSPPPASPEGFKVDTDSMHNAELGMKILDSIIEKRGEINLEEGARKFARHLAREKGMERKLLDTGRMSKGREGSFMFVDGYGSCADGLSQEGVLNTGMERKRFISLLNIIGTLDSPSGGEALVLGKSVGKLSHKEAAALRKRKIGFIFQTYNLLSVYSVFENIEFPLLMLRMPPSERKKAVWQALEWVGLTDKVKSRPAQLSGGESQRVAIARAMVKRPEIVLADEPTANLDAQNSHNILQAMERLNRELKTTFIFATHDEKVIQYLRRKISLRDGKVVNDEQIRKGEK
jgi:putative ABC transport system ATP-binding protein